MQPVKTTSTASVPVFQTMLETAQGGFSLDNTGLAVGETIKAGTPIGYDEATRVAKVLKVATLQANAANDAVDYRVMKGHNIKVGDYLAAVAGGKAYAVTEIDTSNAAYDELTVGTTLGVALTAPYGLFVSSATGASAAVVAVTAKGLLYEDTEVSPTASVAVVLRGTVYDRRITAIPSAVKTALPLIIFSQSY